jgi:ATP-dependent DNA helicase RecQ
VDVSRITKMVVVIDEAQDMDGYEYHLINLLKEKNEELRIIAVGDDDQNIYSFRGSDSKFMKELLRLNAGKKYELLENFRSRKNLVEFSNQFVRYMHDRFKSNPTVPVHLNDGKIRIVTHKCDQLIEPLVNDLISTGLVGSTCVLTKTNEEALQITGKLVKLGYPAKLIQSHDEFSLFNLQEVRYFLDGLNLQDGDAIIPQENWRRSKDGMLGKFSGSTKLELAVKLLRDFEDTNPGRKYRTDLDIFIRESRLEDVYTIKGELIYVSTIHKAKGKEFDNVFLMLNNFDISLEENKRQLYVAMTRAKNNLAIHYNGNFLDRIHVSGLQKLYDDTKYSPEDELHVILTHHDIYLG